MAVRPELLARLAAPLALLAALGLGCVRGDGGVRPDLLLVTVDTLRADALGCYGGPAAVGEAICSLGERGVRYEWALTTAPSTAPSIASVLTSLYADRHGVTQFAVSWLEQDMLTVAEVLGEAGYATGAIVSNPVLGVSRQLDQGFQHYDVRMTRREANRPELAEREAKSTTDAALGWLGRTMPPRFLWVHYQDPHGPYDPPDGSGAAGADHGAALPVLDDHSGKGGIPSYQVVSGVRSLAAYRARYSAEIRYLDAHLERLLAALPDAGVLLTSDHGEAFGEDGYYLAHGHSVGIEQLRVPLLWRPPGGIPAAVVTTPVSGVDLAPTLLAAAGIPAPAGFEGVALPGRDAEAARDRLLFAEHRARAAVVAGRRYYARDRVELAPGRRDRISGGILEPFPPRTAWLRGGQAAAYEAVDPEAPPALEEQLRGHLERQPSGGPKDPGLAGETREELRALGYLE